jgi:hypothetical protein
MDHRSDARERRPERSVPHDLECMVPLRPIRDADRPVRSAGLALLAPLRAANVADLRRQIREGFYASEAMMDVVARRMVERGEL